MDYDSSSKFISSLAKFLQSLCNGYVEFDNGVHVIGHLYLSVDTGTTIDYILNEKVCKTDENSVTFISNSFHAQPAEKPKPPGKRTAKDNDKTESKNEENADNYAEPRSTNVGTIPASGNGQNSIGSKRPYSPSHRQSLSKSGRSPPRHKKSRTESFDQNSQSQISNPASENSISSAPSPAADGASLTNTTAQGSDAQYGESYQQNFFSPDEENSMADESEERDIKPSIDTDVTFIKEEFAPSSSCAQSDGDRSHGEDSSLYPYQSNQVFPGSFSGQGGFGASASGSLRSNFNAAGDRSSHMFSAGQGSSQLEGGESSGDPSASDAVYRKQHGPSKSKSFAARSPNYAMDGEPFYLPATATSKNNMLSAFDLECKKCTFVSRDSLAMSLHKRTCNGKRHLTCSICSKVLSRYDSLAEHMRGIHGIGGKVQCRFCGKKFKYRPQMYQHQAVCAARRPKFDSEMGFSDPAFVKTEGLDSKISFPYDVTMAVDMDSIRHQLFESKS